MFEFGFWELVLILVLILVVAGPERLPGIVRTLGRWAGRAKALAGQLKDEFEREVHADDLRRAMREAEDAARMIERDVETTARAAVQGPRPAEPKPPAAAPTAGPRDG
jgi:sec-independent protein translocase protein TatB